MDPLSKKNCVPCQKKTTPLQGEKLMELLQQLDQNWQLVNEHHLEKTFLFPNFKRGLEFTNQVGELAEREGHHPDIYLSYDKVKITLWTHRINGLTESDFILAAKCDEILTKDKK